VISTGKCIPKGGCAFPTPIRYYLWYRAYQHCGVITEGSRLAFRYLEVPLVCKSLNFQAAPRTSAREQLASPRPERSLAAVRS
jgi:hypothetical protein